MRKAMTVLVVLSACAPSPSFTTRSIRASAPEAAASSDDEARDTGRRAPIDRMLDDWHDAAARADEARYFGHIAERGVFLGTDLTERWGKASFRAYAHPHFAEGRAWSFHATERHVTFGADGATAWFDERLATSKLGTARGSGVVSQVAPGIWQIVHYDLSIPIPNDRFAEVKAVLSR